MASITDAFELDKPWPLNFLAYMFEPGETTDVVGKEAYPKGVRVSVAGMEISGSGVITGDFGRSITIARNMPVMDMLGPAIYLAFASVLALIVTFTFVASLQRVGRPTSYSWQPLARTVTCVSRLPLDPAGAALQGRRF
jgi:hypothetical protein